jgi:site-specific recombinase
MTAEDHRRPSNTEDFARRRFLLAPGWSGANSAKGPDLGTLLDGADPEAALPERHLWLALLLQWLRTAADRAAPADCDAPVPLLRLRHLLHHLSQDDVVRERVRGVLLAFWREIDMAALFADFGFAPRMALASELRHRIAHRWLPATPDTRDLAALFPLLFEPADARWLQEFDDDTLASLAALMSPTDAGTRAHWRRSMLDGITFLVSAVRSAGFSPALRQRMSAALLADEPYRQLAHAADRLAARLLAWDEEGSLREASYLRALLNQCVHAADSIAEHLEEYGVSVDIVFQIDQLRERCARVDRLLDCVLSPQPARGLLLVLLELLRVQADRRGVRPLLARHYSLMARKVAERGAEAGETYITRTRDAWRAMLMRAAGGGAVLAGTTLVKFGVIALGLSAFWSGWWAGINYAASFVLIYLLHWTVATKQPAMTAPAMAAKLRAMQRAPSKQRDGAVEEFVDEVANLIRTQMAGIIGNLAVAFPLVLAVQVTSKAVFGATPIGRQDAEHILHSLTLLGPTPLYAAFTGALLFASSLIAGWTENWFVFHRLDSAIAWHPRLVARFGSERTHSWAAWWRAHVSGLAANVSLGLMLGVLPVVLAFFGFSIEVRHVTLSTGQLAAALGSEGWGLLKQSAFWWCVGGIALTGALNLTVSFMLAFRVALRSRGIRLKERGHIYASLRRRIFTRPRSFVLPPAD